MDELKKILDYIIGFETFKGYPNYGLTQGQYNINGTKALTPQVANLGDAKDAYLNLVLRGEVATISKDFSSTTSPNSGIALAAIVSDMQVNQYDALGSLAIVASKLGGRINDGTTANDEKYTRLERDKTYYDNGDHSKYRAGELDYTSSAPYNVFKNNKSEIIKIYQQDPEKFLKELTTLRVEMYSRGNQANLAEWSERAIDTYKYANDILNNGIDNVNYRGYFNDSSSKLAGQQLSQNIINSVSGNPLAGRSLTTEQEYDDWYNIIHNQFVGQNLSPSITAPVNTPSTPPTNTPQNNSNVPKSDGGFFGSLFGGNGGLSGLFGGDGGDNEGFSFKSILNWITGKNSRSPVMAVGTSFYELIAKFFGLGDKAAKERLDSVAQAETAKIITLASGKAASDVIGSEQAVVTLTGESADAMNKSINDVIKMVREDKAFMASLTADGVFDDSDRKKIIDKITPVLYQNFNALAAAGKLKTDESKGVG